MKQLSLKLPLYGNPQCLLFVMRRLRSELNRYLYVSVRGMTPCVVTLTIGVFVCALNRKDAFMCFGTTYRWYGIYIRF